MAVKLWLLLCAPLVQVKEKSQSWWGWHVTSCPAGAGDTEDSRQEEGNLACS